MTCAVSLYRVLAAAAAVLRCPCGAGHTALAQLLLEHSAEVGFGDGLALDSASRVVLRDVKFARDLGSVIELASGVSTSDRVVDSPPDSLQSGDLVRVVTRGGGA